MRFLLGLLAVVFLGSCASENGLFIKRRYTQGYYFNHNTNKHVHQNDPHTSELKKTIKEKTALVVTSSALVAKNVLDRPPVLIAALTPKKHGGIIKKSTTTLTHKSELGIARSFSGSKIKAVKKPAHDLGFIPILEGAGVAIVCFIVFTLIYTLCILAKTPDMNIVLALCIGMLFSLLTICTGVFVTC